MNNVFYTYTVSWRKRLIVSVNVFGKELIMEMLEYDFRNNTPLLHKFSYELGLNNKTVLLLKILPFSEEQKVDCVETFIDPEYDYENDYDFW